MKIKSTLIAVSSIGLIAGTMVGVVAQDGESIPRTVAYATGTAGDPQAVVEPTLRRTVDDQVQFSGLRLDDIPVQFTDSRLSGLLAISSNGAGRDFVDGHARLEPRTYRIDNVGGAWTGAGERILALSVHQTRPLINHESMVLVGEGGYEGLVAYVFIELANAEPELEAVILDVEIAPLPDQITTRPHRDVPGPQRPTANSVAPTAVEHGEH